MKSLVFWTGLFCFMGSQGKEFVVYLKKRIGKEGGGILWTKASW
jgi:hypothetical protein